MPGRTAAGRRRQRHQRGRGAHPRGRADRPRHLRRARRLGAAAARSTRRPTRSSSAPPTEPDEARVGRRARSGARGVGDRRLGRPAPGRRRTRRAAAAALGLAHAGVDLGAVRQPAVAERCRRRCPRLRPSRPTRRRRRRGTRAARIAPAHIGHGSRVTTRVVPVRCQSPVCSAAARRAITSAWAVGSWRSSRSLRPVADHDAVGVDHDAHRPARRPRRDRRRPRRGRRRIQPSNSVGTASTRPPPRSAAHEPVDSATVEPMRVHVADHPLITHKLTVLRDKSTPVAHVPGADRRARHAARLRGHAQRPHRAGRHRDAGRPDHGSRDQRSRDRSSCRSCAPASACSRA